MDRPAPEIEAEDNSEQAEAGTQAQDVAEDARLRRTETGGESERGGRTNPAQIIPDDTPDLVETINAMERSGRIDMDAYAGEPQMDDEEEGYGPTEDEE